MGVRKIFAGQPSIQGFLFSQQISYFIRLILLIGLALTSYLYFEKPIMKLKRYFEYKKHELQQASKSNEIYQIAD